MNDYEFPSIPNFVFYMGMFEVITFTNAIFKIYLFCFENKNNYGWNYKIIRSNWLNDFW